MSYGDRLKAFLNPEHPPNWFSALAQDECHECGDLMEPVRDDKYDLECPTCGINAYHRPRRSINSIADIKKLPAFIYGRLYPETVTLGWALILLGAAILSVVYFDIAPLPESSQVWAGVALFAGALTVGWRPAAYCPECGFSLWGSSPNYCANCGYQPPPINSFMEYDPGPSLYTRSKRRVGEAYGRLREVVGEAGPSWVSPGWTFEYTSTDIDSLADRLVDGRERQWRWFFNVGLVVFVAIHLLTLYIFARLVLEFSLGAGLHTIIGSGGGGSGGGGEFTLPTLIAILTAIWEFLVALAPLLALLAFGGVFVIVPHELAHAIAAKAEGWDVKEGQVSFLFGFLPSGGYIRPNMDMRQRIRRPLESARVVAAGTFADVLVLSPAVVWLYLHDVPVQLGELSIPSAVGVFIVLNVIVVLLNAGPVPKTDGMQFHAAAVYAVADRLGSDDPMDAANMAAGMLTLSFICGIVLLLL